MDKKMMELQKAIERGVKNGIVAAGKQEGISGKQEESLERCAENLKRNCEEQNECISCKFYEETAGCKVNFPHLWGM